MIESKRIPDILSGLFVGLVLLLLAFPARFFSGSLAGHAVGIIGSILMGMALVYPFKKRVLDKKGKMNPIKPHLYWGLLGPILVVIHSGGKVESILGLLIYLATLLVVLSGIAGKILFVKLGRSIRGREQELELLRSYFVRQKRAVDAETCRKMLLAEPYFLSEEEETLDSKTVARCRELQATAASMVELESTVQAYATTKSIFSFWMRVHVYGTWVLFALMLVHLMSTWYWGWRWLS